MNAYDVLKKGFDGHIAKAMVSAYREIEENFVLRKWKPSELDAGHFVEAVRRALDLKLTGSYSPFGKDLPKFDDVVIKHYEQQQGEESLRLLIPRALKAIYNIRNKRGVAHISNINPNEMDATFILYTVKWILAELIRLESGLSINDTQHLVDAIVERKCPLVWKYHDITRILVPGMKAREQVLVLLYESSPRTDTELLAMTEYSNSSQFGAILRKLHKNKLIYYDKEGKCIITPHGMIEAESIINRNS